MKICFLAPSGYGKSTAIEILKKHYEIENIKIAEPLYELQKNFYEKMGIDVKDRQDGELLQFYGRKIREVSKNYLLDEFIKKVNKSKSSIITNDDCRPDDYKFLKENGFIFIKINGYKRDRDDISEADRKSKLEWQSIIPYDYEIDNFGMLEEYKTSLIKLINRIIVPKCYIVPAQKLCNCDCIFCISKSRNYDKKDGFLTVDDKFIENVHTLKKHGVKRFEITGGGEPMLNKELENIVFTIKHIIPDSYIKLYTNGNILRKVNGIDEINISVVSECLDINNRFMNGNDVELIDKIKFFKDTIVKLRLSIPLIKGGIDESKKLDSLINKTIDYVDEFVVRTLYPNTKDIDNLYADFDYEHDKVIMEKANGLEDFNGVILWSDNKFYNSWELDKEKYFYSYLLLKPDSKEYINEIEDLMLNKKFKIVRRFILNDFKDSVIKLYEEKSDDYKKIIKRQIDSLSYLFGDKALVFILDKEKSLEELYFDTLNLKREIREKFSFTNGYGGYVLKDGETTHVNLVHCPDVSNKLYDRDLNYLMSLDSKEVGEKELKKIKKYRSYNV